ncbi:hypothetical protein [Polystyrenella longa]|nr:hypothetical protein [Polystyrenella longa]
MRSVVATAIASLLLGVSLSGCSSKEEVDSSRTNSVDNKGVAKLKESQSIAPEEALRHLVENFQTEPELVWNALPASFQESLQNQQQMLAKRIDPTAWQQMNRLLGQLSQLFEKHRDDILDAQDEQPLPMLGRMNASQLDYLQGILKSLSSAPFADLEKLQNREFRELWMALAPQLFKPVSSPISSENTKSTSETEPEPETLPILTDYFARLSRIDVSLVERQGDKAILKLVDPQVPDEPSEIEFVLVEGKWIPASWNESWPLWMGRTKLVLDQFANYLNGFALAQSRQIQELEDRLMQLNTIDDHDEFVVAWQGSMQELNARLPVASRFSVPTKIDAQPARQPLEEIDIQSTAVIVISRPLSKAEIKTYSALILELSQYPEVAVLLPPEVDQQQTRFRLMPVPDVEAVSKNIGFGTVEKIDSATNQILVVLPSENTGQ